MTIPELIRFAREAGASDIHLSDGASPMLRKDGEMIRLGDGQQLDHFEESLFSLLPQPLRASFLDGEDADFAYADEDGRRYRVNIFRKMGSFGCVIRLLNENIPTLESLDMPPVLRDLAMLPRGLVLVTGPTGSGKSTTLAAMIDHANRNRKSHIITVEDPVEYLHRENRCLISQREVGRDVKSFAAALRSALREDPDIILVGEMRDFETISAALTAAETGHLVLSTLHTTGAAKTIDRIIDVFPPAQQGQVRVQLSSVLRAVVTQQLVRKIGGGRRAALEIMLCTDAVANMIREGKTNQIDSAMQTGQRDGMILLNRSLAQLVNSGEVSYEEALSACVRPEEFKRFAQP